MPDSHRFLTASKPCPGCPWRTDTDASDIPDFSLELAENLAQTCPRSNSDGPQITDSMFACHQSVDGQEFACAGWLATVGHRHPRVRLAVSLKELSPHSLAPKEDWPELHNDFAEVIAKLRDTAPSADL